MLRTKRTLFLVCALAVCTAVAGFFTVSLAAPPKKALVSASGPHLNSDRSFSRAPVAMTGALVGHAIGFAETGPARDLPPASGDLDAAPINPRELDRINTSDLFPPDPKAPKQFDGALQATWTPKKGFRLQASNIPTPILTFEGIPADHVAPSDSSGAVGPNDYVQVVNTLVRVYDKNGVPRGPAFKMSSLFAPLGGLAAQLDNGDPIVLYDRMANRWILTQFAYFDDTTPPFHQPIAVSKTGDPMGAYWVYDFVTPGTDFPDFGKMGVWPDGYYFSDRQFTTPSLTYDGFGCIAFDRKKMLVGDPTATYIYFNAGPNLSLSSSGMIPTDFYGLTPPPTGAPNVFAVYNDDANGDPSDSLRLFDFHADFTTPASSTFIERPESPLLVAPFDARSPAGRADIEQPSPATPSDYLDSTGDRLMLRFQYLNRGGVETLTTCHTVNAGTIPAPATLPTSAQYKAGTRWYILQKGSPAASWTVGDQGTFSPDSNERWMGSTSLDNAGNLAVGYSISSSALVPSIAYAGRLAGDAAGTLAQGETIMFSGTGVQLSTGNRWGEYTNMSLDPVDDATFWYTNQYIGTTGQFTWQTRIGKFKFTNTTAPAQGTLRGTVTACDTGMPVRDALVQVAGGVSTGFSSATAADGTYSLNLTPGSYTVTITDSTHNCVAAGPFNVTITNGASTTQDACLTGAVQFVYNSATPLGGNGNGMVEPNECNSLNVAILNNGCSAAKNVSAVLSTSTAGVTVTQPNSPYSDTNENGTATNSVPFAFSTANTVSCGTVINFTLTVKYTGGSVAIPFSLTACSIPTVVVNGALTGSDPQEPNGHILRNGTVASCGFAKSCPGVSGSGPRIYRQHTFANGPVPACVTVNATQACPSPANDVIPVAYLGSFDPNNLCANYLGDVGESLDPLGASFSVNVPANSTLVVVVQEANPGLAGCTSYTLNVSGLIGSGSGNGTCAAPPSVVSRKQHGASGTFDIAMPLTGPTGVEDRLNASGNHTIVLTYPSDPTGAVATVVAHNPSTTGTGTVSGTSVSGNDLIVNLTGVSNAQILTLSVSGGTNISPAVAPIGFLVGDVSGDRVVNAADATQARNLSGQTANAGSFRADLSADGTVNAADATIARNNSGQALP